MLGAGVLAVLPQANAAVETKAFVDQRTGVNGWSFEHNGIRVELIQRLPNQTRAFFLGRGFNMDAANRLASRCVFQTIVRNTQSPGSAPLSVDLDEWRVQTPQGARPLILKQQWQQEWQERGLDKSARIAFQWSLFPTRQTFQPGDWNMGMTTYPVPPGTRIDVQVVWHSATGAHHGTVRGAVCATDALEKTIREQESQ